MWQLQRNALLHLVVDPALVAQTDYDLRVRSCRAERRLVEELERLRLGDLDRGTRFFVDGNELQIMLPTNSGAMHFVQNVAEAP